MSNLWGGDLSLVLQYFGQGRGVKKGDSFLWRYWK